MAFTADITAWNHYFSSDEYRLPHPGGILLLHPCTWGKPYDLSFNGTELVKSLPEEIPINRCIVSNVGIVPCEYQVNETFVSYDYNVLLDGIFQDKREGGQFNIGSIISKRVEIFLRRHMHDIGGFILVGHAVNSGFTARMRELYIELGIKGRLIPYPQDYLRLLECVKDDPDPDALLFNEESLLQLKSSCRDLWRFIR